jgi:hypothetical protein
MEEPYQKLLEENLELRKALTATKELCQRYRSDNEGMKTMHEDYRVHYDRTKQENLELIKDNTDLAVRLKEATEAYNSQISRLRTGLEQKKKELEEAMSRIIAPLDSDMLRLKLIAEIEGPHRQAIERLQSEVNAYEAKSHAFANQLSLLQQESANYRVQSEKEYRDLEQRYLTERAGFAQELQALHGQIEELSDPEPLRQARKERDELRRRVSQQSTEIEDLVKTRERLKSEKSAIQVSSGRELEEERDQKHAATTARDSLNLQLKDLADQLSQAKLQYDLKSQAVGSLLKERDELRVTSKVFEEQVMEYRSEVGRVREELQRKTTEWELRLKRQMEAEENKLEKEKSERERLQKDLEIAEKRLGESGKAVSDRSQRSEIDRLQLQLKNEQDERALLKASTSKLQQENEIAKENTAQLKNREEQLRSLHQQLRELENGNNELRSRVRSLEDDLHNSEKEVATLRAKSTGEENQKRLSDLKAKVREYKGKVRLCNDKIGDLLHKLATSEVQRQRLESEVKTRGGMNSQLASVVGTTLARESARQGHTVSELSASLRPS